jgi:glutathione S-transferase
MSIDGFTRKDSGMTGKRLLIHSIFLFLLPLVVAWYGVSVGGAIALVFFALAWRWVITLSGLLAPAKTPEIELETIAASHFVEKVRWCMDRLGIDYTERQWVGVLGIFSTGRSVPELKIRTGMVRSTIGNSPEILRYLWGAYTAKLGDKAKFLEPTPDRLALEERLDRYGVDLQVWVYYHILDDRELTQHAWGCNSPLIPAWQRYIVIAVYPVLRILMRRAFRITDSHYAKSVEHIESILAEVESLLADGRNSILGGESIDYVDITFASLSALWLQPPEFGRDKADMVRIDRERAPDAMRADIDRWIEKYPYATGFISRLYQQERLP